MQHGPWVPIWFQVANQTTQPSVATGTTDVSSDPGCHRAMNPYKALSSSSGMEHTMALYGSTGHLDQHDSGGRMPLRHLDGHQWHPCAICWPQTLAVVHLWDPEMALGSSPRLDIIMALSGKKASNISLHLTTFTSVLPCSHSIWTIHFSLYHILVQHIGVNYLVPGGPLNVFLTPQVMRTQNGLWVAWCHLHWVTWDGP